MSINQKRTESFSKTETSLSDSVIIAATFLLSGLASVYFILTRITINTDAVVYLAAAERLQDLDISGASDITVFVFFPALIALLSELTGMSLVLSSDILNTLFLSGMAAAFLLCLKSLGADRVTLVLGGILIILHPALSGYRDSVFRDSGFWMMCLLSLYFIEQYAHRQRFVQGAMWAVSVVLATLFRPEAAALILTPLAITLDPAFDMRKRLKVIAYPLGVVVFAGLCFLVLGLTSGYGFVIVELYSDFIRYLELDTFNIFSPEALVNIFPPFYPEEYGWLSTLLAMLPILFDAFCRSLSWPVLVILGFCCYQGTIMLPSSKVYRAYLLIGILVPVCFMLVSAFLTPRYMTAFALYFMLMVPFAVRRYMAQREITLRHKVLAAATLFVLFMDCFVSFGYSDRYVLEAIRWVQSNTPEDSRVISNERKITYSTGRKVSYDDSEKVFWEWEVDDVIDVVMGYDYFIEDTNWDDEELMPSGLPNVTEVARFTNERGNRAVVYEIE